MTLRLRRGTDAERLTIVPALGEPIYVTDTEKMYIGDGVTTGGNELQVSAIPIVWGDVGGTLSNQTDLQTALNGKENTGVAAGLDAAHVAALDPHTQYLKEADAATLYEPANANIQSHISSTSNPHSVTAAQVGAYTTGQTDTLLNGKMPLTPTVADFVPGAPPAHVEGRVFYDSGSKSLAYYNDINGVTLNIGLEQWARVYNPSIGTILNGQVVTINGAFGTNPTVGLADAINTGPEQVLGVCTEDIGPSSQGVVTTFGLVNDLNTSGWADGTVLYLSSSVPGGLTDVAPADPTAHVIAIGIVAYSHATNGKLFVNPKTATGRAFHVETDTTNFNAILSVADDTVQKALETLDDHSHGTTYAPLSHTHAATDITSGTLNDARLSANVLLTSSTISEGTWTGI